MREYQILRDRMSYPDEMERRIQKLASEGWEVVAYALASDGDRLQREALLSRPLPSF